MGSSFTKFVDSSSSNKPLSELLQASPAILKGVTEADAEQLELAFSIDTVEALARNSIYANAQALLAASDTPNFDPGPPNDWSVHFHGAPCQHYVDHSSGRFRLAFGPVFYRGRLDGTARILIVGQDPSTDEILAQRAFVGSSGQRLQGLLKKLGITRSYVMMNTFIFSVFKQFDSELRQISLETPILSWRNDTFDRVGATNPIEAVIAVGAGARHAVEHWPGAKAYPVFEITHPAAPDDVVLPNWNQHLPNLGTSIAPDEGGNQDLTPYAMTFQSDDPEPIPRFDLPFGMPDWHGTGATRSFREGNKMICWSAL